MARKVGKWNPSLHPRDARGRFTRSSTRVMKGSDTSRARSAVTGFRPAKIDTAAAAAQWLAKHAGAAPADDSAMGRYLAGGWRETNPAIRREKTPPPDVVEIDAAFTPLAEDLVLRRQVPLAMFAHIPVGDLVGMKVRDAAYASTSIDQPGLPSAPDAVTLHIAAPAGTPAFVNPDAGEVLLGRDTEIAVTRAEPNGAGGWDLYGVVIPTKAIKRGEPAAQPADDTPTAAGDDTAAQTAGDTDTAGGDAGSDDAPEASAGTASAPADAAAQDGSRQADQGGDTATDGAAPPAGGGRGRGRADSGPRAAASRPQDDTTAPAGRDQPTGDQTPAAGTSAPSDAGPPQQLDIAGGAETFDKSRTEVGLPERPQVGRERAIAQVQQLGLFASDEREMAGQEALLDALLAMPAGPAAAPPPDAPPAPLAPVPDAGEDDRAALIQRAVDDIKAMAGAGYYAQVLNRLNGSGITKGETEQLRDAVRADRDAFLDDLEVMSAIRKYQSDLAPVGDEDMVDSAGRRIRLHGADYWRRRGQRRASIVPDDLTGWNDEQLAELFRTVSADEDLDEAGLGRIAAEWDRREAAMRDLVASVPDDLTGLPDDEVETLYARLTAELGTMDADVVARLGDELDRRTEAARAAAEAEAANAPKRALLARPLAELSDDEIETAAGYASDLGDEAALVRVYAEWERREAAAQAAEAAAQAEREAREAAERAEAARQAEIATARAAAEHAEAARRRQFDAFGAAAAAAIVPRLSEADVNTAVGLLGEDGMRRLLGDAWVDAQFGDRTGLPELSEIARNGLMMTGARQLPPGDQVRILFAAADLEADREFGGWTNSELNDVIRDGMFIQGADRERGRRAGRELTRRKVRTLRAERAEQFRQARVRAAAAPPGELTDAELELAPVLVTVDNPDAEDVVARLGALRGEVERRQAELARIAAAKAAGPAAPARYANPMQRYGDLLLIATRPSSDPERQARDRLRRAQAAVYGLPEDAAEKDIKAAARKDPRPYIDQAVEVLTWYRHLAAHEDIGETGIIGGETRTRVGGWPVEYLTGWPDDADVPDTPAPLPPAYVSKADEVWEAIRDNARDEIQLQNRYDTAGRSLRAIARTYRIPVPPISAGGEGLGRLQHQVTLALRGDNRHPKDRAADFLAQFRALAAEDGVDPADTLRYGPPDKAGRKPTPATFRASTPAQQKRIDELIARGWDYLDAYADVHGVDPDELRRSQAGSDREIRQAYAEFVEQQYRAAEAATAGNLLKRSAAARGVDARGLFSGPWAAARARASEELLRWWADNPRMTYADFKANMVGGADARAARERMITAGKGNQFA